MHFALRHTLGGTIWTRRRGSKSFTQRAHFRPVFLRHHIVVILVGRLRGVSPKCSSDYFSTLLVDPIRLRSQL